MIKVLAFDVSETLQTGSDSNDNGLGQPMVMGNEVIPGAYSVMVGGLETAKLLKRAQEKGIAIVLVTNNGDDLDKGVIDRTLDFLKRYGVIVARENYMGPPPQDNNGSKVPRLKSILQRFDVTKEEMMFFDDSANNVLEAEEAGFQSIRVKTPENLQTGILDAINSFPLVEEIDSKSSVSVANEDDQNKQRQDGMTELLDSYLKEREAVKDSTGTAPVEYFYGSFFAVFQKSYTQKKDAVNALKSALEGNEVDLSKHLSTLTNGNLGNELRAFIKAGKANELVRKEVTTVSDFVSALQEQIDLKFKPV